jgi:hypothetical protein
VVGGTTQKTKNLVVIYRSRLRGRFSLEDEANFQERQMQEQLQELQERLLSSTEVREMIARRAYEIYERRGYVPGHDKEDWFQAEREILNRFMKEDLQREASKAPTSHSQLERAGMAAKKAIERTSKRMKTTRATVTPKPAAQASLGAPPNDKSKLTPKSLKTRSQKAYEAVVSEATETLPSIPETGPDERISRRTPRSKTAASATKENSPGAPKKSLS